MTPIADYSTTASDNTSISGLTVTDATVADTLDNIIRQLMADIKSDYDAARPVSRGGTGATTAVDARTELGVPGLAGNNTFSGDNTFTGTTTIASLVAATADINGGAIDSTVIGATTPAAGTFAALTATGSLAVENETPDLKLYDTNQTSNHGQIQLLYEAGAFRFRTLTNAGVLAATDYQMSVNGGGATEHSFRIQGTERLQVDSGGVDVTGTLSASANVSFSALLFSGSHIPNGSDNLGSSSLGRWQSIFLVNAPNVSSDARRKENIADLTDAERRAAAKIKTRTFTMIEGGQKKVGYIAQEVIEAMQSEGLCAFEYGLVSDGDLYGVDMDAINAFRLG